MRWKMTSDEVYRADVEDCMQYAKWFRPFMIFSLFITIFSEIELSERTIQQRLGKSEYEDDHILAKTLTM